MAKTATVSRRCCAANLPLERRFMPNDMSNKDHNMTAQALAEAAAASMLSRDNATAAMGIALAEVGPGYARMTMTVRPDMLNGHQSCHGGFIFALADSAFAFACNSYNLNTVGAGCRSDRTVPGRQERYLRRQGEQSGWPCDCPVPWQVDTRGWQRDTRK